MNNEFRGGANPKYAIDFTGAADKYTRFITANNSFVAPFQTGVMSQKVGIVHHNQGYVTENSGASTGTGAQQTVAHGLGFTPTRQQVSLSPGSATAVPYHSADPDGTNIYVTAANLQAWYWATVG